MAPVALHRARVRVPCSTSNLGAGFDTIGLAFKRYITAEFIPKSGALSVERSGTCAGLADEHDVLLRAFVFSLSESRVFPAGTIKVDSSIPLARGLGSSAAAVVAGLALGQAALGIRNPDRALLLNAAVDTEGHPDNAAPSVYGGLVAVAHAGAGARAFALPLSAQIGFSFAAPNVEVSTPAARKALPTQVPHALATRGLGRVAALVRGLETGDRDLLRIGFDDELHVQYRLPLIPNAALAREEALAAGAWAVTISGSGSGLIAVSAPANADEVARAMASAFGQTDPQQAFTAEPETGGTTVEVDA